ncbi:hypothetical protein PC120_g11196 [Phytophthora cactorum]|nr:hypothetical protein PC120_g11196 [Phytophthora cactorum]
MLTPLNLSSKVVALEGEVTLLNSKASCAAVEPTTFTRFKA